MPVTIKDFDLQSSDIIHDAGYGQGYPEYDHGYRADHFWENEDRGEPDIKEFDKYAVSTLIDQWYYTPSDAYTD